MKGTQLTYSTTSDEITKCASSGCFSIACGHGREFKDGSYKINVGRSQEDDNIMNMSVLHILCTLFMLHTTYLFKSNKVITDLKAVVCSFDTSKILFEKYFVNIIFITLLRCILLIIVLFLFFLIYFTVFLDCLSTIFKTGPVFSKHYTQLAQPHTQLTKHYRSFA